MNVLQEVVRKHANQKPKKDVTALQKRERELVAERDLLADCRANLLLVEESAKKQIDEKMTEANTELARVRSERFLAEQGYPILDPEPFRMRDETGLPKLALFSVDCPTCQFYFSNSYGSYFFSPNLPKSYAGVYDDVECSMSATLSGRFGKVKQQFRFAPWGVVLVALSFWLLYSRPPGFVDNLPAIAGIVVGVACIIYGMLSFDQRFDGLTLAHTVKFSGIIPKEKREKLGMLMQTIGPSRVFLLAEVDEWGKTIKTDPLVLISDDEYFYVADSFDTTTLERYVTKEFVRETSAPGS